METRAEPAASLRQAQGFLVESAGTRIGVVDGLRDAARTGIPGFLIVRSGRLGRHRMMISVDDIREILPRQKRILLQPTWMTIRI